MSKLSKCILLILVTMVIGCSPDSDYCIDSHSNSLKYRAETNSKNECCMFWALGIDYGSLPRRVLDDVWNKRHGNIFMLKGTDNYSNSIEQIKKECFKRNICQ